MIARVKNFIKALIGRKPIPHEPFTGHYVEWRERRIAEIISHYGRAFFAGKTLLEVGCGYGDVGEAFVKLGADVTFSDARSEHLNVLLQRGDRKTVRADLDKEWPFKDRFDVLIHMGVLYHLANPDLAIRHACAGADYLILETEVCDSLDPHMSLVTKEEGYDQALNHTGCRPSTRYVERLLTENGMKWERLTTANCNSGYHVYDWAEQNTGTWRHGLRRMWFAERSARRQV